MTLIEIMLLWLRGVWGECNICTLRCFSLFLGGLNLTYFASLILWLGESIHFLEDFAPQTTFYMCFHVFSSCWLG